MNESHQTRRRRRRSRRDPEDLLYLRVAISGFPETGFEPRGLPDR